MCEWFQSDITRIEYKCNVFKGNLIFCSRMYNNADGKVLFYIDLLKRCTYCNLPTKYRSISSRVSLFARKLLYQFSRLKFCHSR